MKNKIKTWIILGITFIVYTVIAFVNPFEKNAVFWLSYIFTVIAIGMQLYVLELAFHKGEDIKSKFYGFPIAKVGFIYLIAQLILSVIMMILAVIIPIWVPIILYVVFLGGALIGLITADIMREEVERQDVILKANVNSMRALQSKVNGLVGISEEDVKADVMKLAEEFRYSDPVSSESLESIELEMERSLDELQTAIVDKDSSAVRELCKKISASLLERNRLCKLNK